MKLRSNLIVLPLAIVVSMAATAAMAATVDMTFNDSLTTGNAGGTATLAITDIGGAGSNEVQVTLTQHLVGPPTTAVSQMITGLWLNAGGLSGVNVAQVSSPNPLNGTVNYSSTQTLIPDTSGAQFNLMIGFLNSGASDINSSSGPEVFDITSTGGTLNASMFNVADLPSGPNKDSGLLAVIGVTDYTGVADSGVGYIAAVPLPASLLLLLSGLGGIGVFAGRRNMALA